MSSFWVEVLIGVISGLVVLAVQLVIDRRGQWATPTPASSTAPHATTTTITVNQTINNNIHYSAEKSESSSSEKKDTEVATYLLWVLAVVVATATFVLYYEYVVAALIGIAVALTVVAVRLLARSRQTLGVTDHVMRSAVEVFAVVVTMLVTALGVLFTTRGALTVGGIRQAAPSSPSDGNWFAQVLAPITGQVKWLFDNSVANALPFAASMFAAAAIVALLAFIGATTLVRWRAYLKFAGAVSGNPQSVERANKFLELTWPRVAGSAVFCLIAVFLALGWGFDTWLSLQPSVPTA